jgi:hypothetical protein
LAAKVSASSDLIDGSCEDRFQIVWSPGHLNREEVEQVGYQYAEPAKMMELYDPAKLQHGWNCVQGEEIYFIENPGLGLWAERNRFSP